MTRAQAARLQARAIARGQYADPLTMCWQQECADLRAAYEASRAAWRTEVGIASSKADDHPAPMPAPAATVQVHGALVREPEHAHG